METSKVSLRLLIDTKGQKVVFAEAGKDFVDFLLYLLTLPLGTVIRLLTDKTMLGCLGNLYKSFDELNNSYLTTIQMKESILKPTVSIPANEVPLLLDGDELPSKLYRCQHCSKNDATEPYGSRPSLYQYPHLMPPQVSCTPRGPQGSSPSCVSRGNDRGNVDSREKGFVKGVVTYMVMDNLEVRPMSSISSITLLNKLKIQDLSVLEERVVDIGMNEALKLLEESLQSDTVLTRVFLGTMKK